MEQITDIDGNTYKTVKIGDQIWMAENLNVSKYRNGDPIPHVQDDDAWTKLKTGAWCYYKNEIENGKIFGKLYNGYAVYNPLGLAPEGWHIPTDKEWTILTDYLGGEEVAGGKLKEAGTTHWESPNIAATNESGFTGLPGGYRIGSNGLFPSLGSGHFWSVQESLSSVALPRVLFYDIANVGLGSFFTMAIGYSVRCLKD